MKALLESISIHESAQSLRVFEHQTEAFEPFWHYHPEVELTLITQGEGMRFVGDSIEPFYTNDLVLVGKNLPHQWVTIGEASSGFQSAVVIQFPEKIFAHFPELKLVNDFLKAASKGIHFPSPEESFITKIKSLPDLSLTLQLSQLMVILHGLSERKDFQHLSQTTKFHHKAEEKNQIRINVCTSFIVEHLAEPISVGRISEKMNMVPQSFCRWFRQQTGLSFVTFLQKTRIQSACQYLLNTDLPIQQIGFKVGFENISHFNRVFKKVMGASPSQFRKRKDYHR